MKKYIDDNGKRITTAKLVEQMRREKGISLCNGCGCYDTVEGNGYAYGNEHIDSFCQVYGAYAITMTPGQKVSWRTDTPEFAYSAIDPTAENGAVVLFEYAFGNGAAYPQPNGYFELSVDGEPQIAFSMKKTSRLFENEQGVRLYLEVRRRKAVSEPGDEFTLDEYVKNESLYINGMAYLYIPHELLKGRTALTLSVAAHNYDEASRRWFRVGFGFFALCGDIYDGVRVVTQGETRPVLDGENIYFGDIHVHTAQTEFLNGDGCGMGTVESNLRYARDVSRLDFCAITDHDWQLEAKDWAAVRAENRKFNKDGKFVALNAFEWTSAAYGHRNVYLRDGEEVSEDLKPFDYQAEPYEPIKYGVVSDDDPTPEDLWNWIEENRLEAITIPHHPNSEQFLMDFDKFYNPKYDRCVEIYSSWGSLLDAGHPLNVCSERIAGYEYNRYVNRIHMGFVASSDGHDGNAGDANISLGKRHLSHYAGSGHVAVLARELTREEVYDAIKNRHCYAVTGEPILLHFFVENAMMGDVLETDRKKLTWKMHVKGTFPLVSVHLYRDGKPAQEIPTQGQTELEYEGTLEVERKSVFFLEIRQADGEYAWSGPIQVISGEKWIWKEEKS